MEEISFYCATIALTFRYMSRGHKISTDSQYIADYYGLPVVELVGPILETS